MISRDSKRPEPKGRRAAEHGVAGLWSVPALAAWVALALTLAAAQPVQASTVSWGPRVGASIDPEQFIGGLHFRPSAISRDLYLQPNVEFSVGDNFTVITLAVPLHYHFRTSTSAKPYAGGGFSVGSIHWDDHGRNDFDNSNIEASIDLVGGLEWRLSGGDAFFTELLLGLGDLRDVELVVGWLF